VRFLLASSYIENIFSINSLDRNEKTSKRLLKLHVISQRVAESLKLRVLCYQIRWHQLASQLPPSFQSRTGWVVIPLLSISFVGRTVVPQLLRKLFCRLIKFARHAVLHIMSLHVKVCQDVALVQSYGTLDMHS
jgi:hypothetical protein